MTVIAKKVIAKKWNKLKCLDCGHVFDMNKGMILVSKTWFFYCIKCNSINVDLYIPVVHGVGKKGEK